MGNMIYVSGFIFLLAFMTYFLGEYDRSLCPEVNTTLNGTITANSSDTWFNRGKEIVDHAGTLQCSNVPSWVNAFIYLPLIAGLIYSVIPLK